MKIDGARISGPLTATIIGSRVQDKRRSDFLTEEAVASALGCDVAYLQAAERGEVNFTAEQIVNLCPILRVVPSWFFEGLA